MTMTYAVVTAILDDLASKGMDAKAIERYKWKADVLKYRDYDHVHDELVAFDPLITGVVDKYRKDGNGDGVL